MYSLNQLDGVRLFLPNIGFPQSLLTVRGWILVEKRGFLVGGSVVVVEQYMCRLCVCSTLGLASILRYLRQPVMKQKRRLAYIAL